MSAFMAKNLKCTKFDFGWGSAPNPAGGAYSASPEPLAGFKGPTSKGRRGEERGGKGRKGGRGWGARPVCLLVLTILATGLPVFVATAQLTRSSADADNRLDAFSGQSRSTNMAPFHMLHIASYCAIVTLSFTIFVFKNFHDLEMGVKGHSR